MKNILLIMLTCPLTGAVHNTQYYIGNNGMSVEIPSSVNDNLYGGGILWNITSSSITPYTATAAYNIVIYQASYGDVIDQDFTLNHSAIDVYGDDSFSYSTTESNFIAFWAENPESPYFTDDFTADEGSYYGWLEFGYDDSTDELSLINALTVEGGSITVGVPEPCTTSIMALASISLPFIRKRS